MDWRRACPNPKCGRSNSPDARFCARCGTTLAGAAASTASVPRQAPHWVFTATFLSFILIVLVALLGAVGPVMLVVVPIALYGLMRGASPGRRRRRARYV